MSRTAQFIISSATTTLQDPDNIRWSVPELLVYLNEGIRELITKRPDANPVKATITPVAGARQQIPAAGVAFIDVLGNATGQQRAITKVDVNLVSAINRDWRSSRSYGAARHFMFDPREPRVFDLFPPSSGTGSIDILYSAFPVDMTSASEAVPVSDQWQNALLNFVLSRAYSKDAEFGGNATAAAAYMGVFNAAIGEQLQSSIAVTPKQ